MKPKVFLSHSAIDKPFISKLYQDLEKYKLEPWIDHKEIRPGKSWMSAIFEHGIPNCHAVLIYYTEKSLQSSMVAKEQDSAFLSQLSDKQIAVIPLVEKETLRCKLRPDIQLLQCFVLNDENYHNLLPTIVAEIWMSYTELTIHRTLLEEKNKRLELQLELESIKTRTLNSPFSRADEADFQFIFNSLNKPLSFTISLARKKLDTSENIATTELKQAALNELELVLAVTQLAISFNGPDAFDFLFRHVIEENLKKNAILQVSQLSDINLPNEATRQLFNSLRTFGFFDTIMTETDRKMPAFISTDESLLNLKYETRREASLSYLINNRFNHFVHWLSFYRKLPYISNRIITLDIH